MIKWSLHNNSFKFITIHQYQKPMTKMVIHKTEEKLLTKHPHEIWSKGDRYARKKSCAGVIFTATFTGINNVHTDATLLDLQVLEIEVGGRAIFFRIMVRRYPNTGWNELKFRPIVELNFVFFSSGSVPTDFSHVPLTTFMKDMN